MSHCILAAELAVIQSKNPASLRWIGALQPPPHAYIIIDFQKSAVGLRDRGAPPLMVYTTLCSNLSSHISELKKACQKGAIMKGNLKTFINI